MKRTLGNSIYAALSCAVLLPLAAAHLSIGCVGHGGESESAPEEQVAEAAQAITGSCTAALFNAPCDPDGAGALTECEGVCRLGSSDMPICVAVASIGGTSSDLNGRLCGAATANNCGGSGQTCNNGVCADPNGANQPVPNGVACQANAGGNPGSLCSGQCNFGVCAAVAAQCTYGRAAAGASNCMFNTCNPINASFCIQVPLPQATTCDDANACTLAPDTCDAIGTCVGGAPKDCADINVCTTDTCEPATGTCGHADNTAPCDDANTCTESDVCSGGMCTPGMPKNCDDADACTAEACDPVNGCTHTPVSCDDNDPCTTDSCNAATGCAHAPAPDGTGCDGDGNSCNGTATCMAGACVAGPAAPCDDANPCTVESCVNNACEITNAADGTACADADMCNGAETCQAGACTPAAAPLNCDDNDPCTTESCDAANGCQHVAVPDCGTGGAGGGTGGAGGGTGGSSSSGSSSSSASSSSSSSGSTTTSSGAGGGTGGSGSAEPGDDAGCGCRVGAAPPSWGALSFASLAALMATLRRRRRDEGSPTR